MRPYNRYPASGGLYSSKKGSALILTIMMVVMLTLEMAIISLIAIRGLGEEGLLMGRNVLVKRGAETAIQRLMNSIYAYLQDGKTPAEAQAAFASGGTDDLEPVVLQVQNPDSGSLESTEVTISAWVIERRGLYYHLIGRAQSGSIDLSLHRWVRLNPCGSNAMLSTILPADESYPGVESMAVSDDGRVYFGEKNATGRFWSWSESTGLSTILPSNENNPGYRSIAIGPDGRVFFGEKANPGGFWTYHPSTGLTTILNSGLGFPGQDDYANRIGIASSDGRVFFAGDSNWPDGDVFTWHSSTGLSTIVPEEVYISDMAVASNGRAFFCSNEGPCLTWHKNTGLTTFISTGSVPVGSSLGFGSIETVVDGSDARVYVGNAYSSGQFWTWHPTTGLSTILPASETSPGYQSISIASSDGRVFFSEQNASGQFWTWHKSTGLTTILPAAANEPGVNTSAVSSDGRIFFSSTPNNRIWTWHKNTGLTTLSTGSFPGYSNSILYNETTQRLFFGDWSDGNYGKFWTWSASMGLSTIGTAFDNPGHGEKRYRGLALRGDDQLYFGEAFSPGRFFTWGPRTGLMTLLPANETKPGEMSTGLSPDGRVFFGENAAAGRLWTWKMSRCD